MKVKFPLLIYSALMSSLAAAETNGFLCTPSMASEYGYGGLDNNCSQSDHRLCKPFALIKSAAQQSADKYSWILQNDNVAKTTLSLNRFAGSFVMEIAYTGAGNFGWSVVGECKAYQLPEPKL